MEDLDNQDSPQVCDFRIAGGQTEELFAAKLQLAGLHSIGRVAVAKIETRIRSVFDFELAVIARVLGVEMASLFPSQKTLKDDLDALIEGHR